MVAWYDVVADGTADANILYAVRWNAFVAAMVTGSTDNAILLADGVDGHKMKGSGITIVTTLGSTDATVPTSRAVKDVTDLKSPIANPAFTGTPTAPTPAAGDNSTTIPTTEWIQKELLQTYPIGAKWNIGSSSPTLTRINWLGNTTAFTTTDFNNHVVWGGMKRCNLSNTGVINAWHGETGFAYDGSNGQVMVWVPKFWYRAVKDVATGYISYWISGQALSGYKIHPAFITNGKELGGFFIGAFEGCAYDTSGSAYNTTDAAGVDFTVTTGDVFSSISAAKPMSGLNNATATLPNFRILAQNRGPGWELQNFNQMCAIQLLYLIEYASFNSQSVLSNGVTNITDDGATNMAVYTGYTAGYGAGSDLANASGEVAIAHYQTAQTTHPFSYRGIENLYGNLWKWVDGINIKANNNPWVANNGFVSDQFSAPYINTNLTLLASNDYVTQIAFNILLDYAFLAITGGGSTSTYLCDYYYQSTGNLSALFGGRWTNAADAGAFYWSLNVASSAVTRYIGARLAFFN